jgi:polyisoprenoid-binding protein YceI
VADLTGTFQLGPDSGGRLLLKTGREGLAAKAGHDLTIEVTRWSATVTVPGEDDGGLAAASVTAELDLGSLAVREGSGGAKPLSDRDRRDIEATMRKILSGSASYASSQAIPQSAGGVLEGTLTVNRRSEPVRLQIASPAPGRWRASATVRQTAFGITPYSGLFGALKLRDEVAVEVEANLEPAGG